jgi:hypothetical protein
MLSTKCACGRFGHEAGRPVARTVRGGDTDDPRVRRIIQSSGVLRDLLAKATGLDREPAYNGCRPPLYIDEGIQPIEPPQPIQSNLLIKFILFTLFFPFLRSRSNGPSLDLV